ncbi:MAG: CoA-binding protein [Deltaproteobacteria bacterium]|nr:CoA-binding protein [Deltaproteobacteria bacterium]
MIRPGDRGKHPDSVQGLKGQLDPLFYPRSIALVGIPRGTKMGKVFLTALLDQGFPGRIFPVNPKADRIDGFKSYPSVSAIPDPVDLAILLVPYDRALPAIQECAAKGVKGAVLFTAGYGETGTKEGKELEAALVRVARSAGMRLIGPNSMGIYAPDSGLAFFDQLPRSPGPVGIISQSGSLAVILARIAPERGISFSKVVSVGNQCDLSSEDFLFYLGNDDKTQVIGLYIEGIRYGPLFLEALRRASREKPVVLWKLGFTPEGSRAASSHTGAISGSAEIWKGLLRQGGGVHVDNFEAWVDTLMGFSLLPPAVTGDGIAIISGPGGLAVAAAEACGKNGLRLPALSSESRKKLAAFIPPTGTSLRNPIDVGLSASMEPMIFARAARIAAADPAVDGVVMIGTGVTSETSRQYTELIIDCKKECAKPFLVVRLPGFEAKLSRSLCEAGIPVLESPERAMSTYARVRGYWLWRQEQSRP